MSIRLEDKYPGKVTPASADYQDGAIRNETVPDVSDDGTPLDFEWGNDFEGLKQRLILMSGITPSDNSDTALGGDILDALFGESSPFKVQPTYPASMQVRASKGYMGSTAVGEQTSSVITAPSVNPRIDALVSDLSGALSVITGAESGSPVAPPIPGDKRGLALISLVVSQTTITDSDITDIRQMVKGPSTSDVTAVTVTPASDADVTLTESQYTADRIVLADGSWTTDHNIVVPDESRRLYVDNSAGTYNATVKTAAGTGVTVSPGANLMVVCDGVNVLSINITQATETASGSAELATQAETDAGVDDQKIVTPLKLANAPVSASGVLAAIASSAAGDVGTYALLQYLGTDATIDFGETKPGADLRPSNADGTSIAAAVSGTWRCMGYSSTAVNSVMVWLRTV